MRLFMGYAFISSFLWIGFVAGFYVGRARTITKVIEYVCEQIEDRKSFELCEATTRENLKRGEP